MGLGDIQIYCCFSHNNWDYKQFDFDGGVEFPPHNMDKPSYREAMRHVRGFTGHVFDFHDVAEMYLRRDYSNYNGFRTVFPSWDNSARTGLRGAVGLNGTPENYEHWLSQALHKTKADYPNEERLVFINAWNEWAEGCHLEPCRKYGHAFLQATRNAKSGEVKYTGWTHMGIPPEAKLASADLKLTKSILGKISRLVDSVRKR